MKHSDAYTTFINQINNNGYFRAQGYNPHLLLDIEEDERNEVEDIIIKLFNEHDYMVIGFLPQLKNIDGINLLKNQLKELSIPSMISADFAKVLLDATNDSYYEQILIYNLSLKDEFERTAILRYLLMRGVNSRLYPILLNICENDSSRLVRFNAASGILYYLGLINDPIHIGDQNQYRDLIDRLSSDIQEERENALKELEQCRI